MKPIGVVTSNIPSTFMWLKTDHGVDQINVSQRYGRNSKTGQEYILILNHEQACAWELCGMLVSPFYNSLVDAVRSRIR